MKNSTIAQAISIGSVIVLSLISKVFALEPLKFSASKVEAVRSSFFENPDELSKFTTSLTKAQSAGVLDAVMSKLFDKYNEGAKTYLDKEYGISPVFHAKISPYEKADFYSSLLKQLEASKSVPHSGKASFGLDFTYFRSPEKIKLLHLIYGDNVAKYYKIDNEKENIGTRPKAVKIESDDFFQSTLSGSLSIAESTEAGKALLKYEGLIIKDGDPSAHGELTYKIKKTDDIVLLKNYLNSQGGKVNFTFVNLSGKEFAIRIFAFPPLENKASNLNLYSWQIGDDALKTRPVTGELFISDPKDAYQAYQNMDPRIQKYLADKNEKAAVEKTQADEANRKKAIQSILDEMKGAPNCSDDQAKKPLFMGKTSK